MPGSRRGPPRGASAAAAMVLALGALWWPVAGRADEFVPCAWRGALPCAWGGCIFAADARGRLSSSGACAAEATWLYLDARAIRELDPDVFASKPNLEVLYLEGNSLSALPPGVFKGLARLKFLFLEDNNLSAALPPSVFDGLPSLSALHLHRNPLACSPAGRDLAANLSVFRAPPPCPLGCPPGTFSCYASAYSCPDPCSPCPAGTFSAQSGATSPATCISCTAGKHSRPGAAGCTPCPAHSVSPAKTGAASNCTCVAGFTGPDGGPCLACPAGTYKQLLGSGACTECPAGSYSGAVGSDSSATCVQCGVGKWSLVSGASSAATCLGGEACSAGKFWSGAQSTCVDCGAGKYTGVPGLPTECTVCPAGKYSAGASATCTPCVAGKYSMVDGASAPSVCRWCNEGQWSSFGSGSITSCYKPKLRSHPTVRKSFFEVSLLSTDEERLGEDEQARFQTAVARAAQVDRADVVIESVRSVEGEGLVIKTSIMSNNTAADTLRSKLTANLDSALQDQGLPPASLVPERTSPGAPWRVLAGCCAGLLVVGAIGCWRWRRGPAAAAKDCQVTPVFVLQPVGKPCGSSHLVANDLPRNNEVGWGFSGEARDGLSTRWALCPGPNKSSQAEGHVSERLGVPQVRAGVHQEWILQDHELSDDEDPPLPIF
jgi:hypothetical protein